MAKPLVLTDEGLRRLENELEELKTVKRKEVAEKIKVALSFGDLSENSEYDEAKNEQAFVESRISQLEAMLKNVQVLDEEELSTDEVSVGCRVRVYDQEFEEELTYQIVGSTEADPNENKISDESPIGHGLLGHRAGDIVEIEVPAGMLHFEVLEITNRRGLGRSDGIRLRRDGRRRSGPERLLQPRGVPEGVFCPCTGNGEAVPQTFIRRWE